MTTAADIALTPVTSSMIAALGYDPETGVLRVQFAERVGRSGYTVPGAVCDYPDFNQADYESLLAVIASGRSIGSYFNLHFRRREYRRVEATADDSADDGKEAA